MLLVSLRSWQTLEGIFKYFSRNASLLSARNKKIAGIVGLDYKFGFIHFMEPKNLLIVSQNKSILLFALLKADWPSFTLYRSKVLNYLFAGTFQGRQFKKASVYGIRKVEALERKSP